MLDILILLGILALVYIPVLILLLVCGILGALLCSVSQLVFILSVTAIIFFFVALARKKRFRAVKNITKEVA